MVAPVACSVAVTATRAILPVIERVGTPLGGSSFSDRDLIAGGNSAPYIEVCATAADHVACLRAGESVAFSEAGDFAWSRPVFASSIRGV